MTLPSPLTPILQMRKEATKSMGLPLRSWKWSRSRSLRPLLGLSRLGQTGHQCPLQARQMSCR